MAKKILAADNDSLLINRLKSSLEQDGYEVTITDNGAEALDLAQKYWYDLVIMEAVFRGMDDYELCERIREFSDVPIIIVSERNKPMDKIMGFDYGADDYVSKPYNTRELKIRIRKVLNRFRKDASNRPEASHTIVAGRLRLDQDSRSAMIDGRKIDLTVKEYQLLKELVSRPGKIFTRNALIFKIWGTEFNGDEKTLDVHIRRLRNKIEDDPSHPQMIRTKWGVGYYFSI
ncbi:MAG: response regulator transcription factor [Eubacterium sp.]|nr:response regulator transcription factor [Eubacterium sp.]